ncbi:MAG TPA: hypothetical protein VMU62_07990 [Acidobacteriaceae bacterium]|nr:hypothetical protein [Acidobacteriaceae bacterium]
MHLSGLASLAATQSQTNTAAAKPSPRLQKAAEEFEANFLQELLKPMSQDPLFATNDGSGGLTGDDGGNGGDGSLGTIDSMGTQAMADALAKAGGFGIAKHILAQLAPAEAANAAKNTADKSSLGVQCGDCATPLTMGEASATADSGKLGLGALQTTETLESLRPSPGSQSIR